MNTPAEPPESKRPGSSALTVESLRPVGELSPLMHYLEQDAGDEGCVAYSRRGLGLGSRLSDLGPTSLPTSPEPEARACFTTICKLFGAEFLIDDCSQRDHCNPSSSATGGDKQSSGQPVKPYAITRKRIREDSDLNPSEPCGSGDDRKGKRRLIEDIIGNEQNQCLYACPFYRACPGDYADCGRVGIKAGRVKEHIKRAHPAHCPTELTTRKKHNWHQIFSILFPNHQTPPARAKDFGYECPPPPPPALRIGQNLTTFMRETRHVLERLFSSDMYKSDPISGSPDLIAETIKLMAILSPVPFIANPPAFATQSESGHNIGAGLDPAPPADQSADFSGTPLDDQGQYNVRTDTITTQRETSGFEYPDTSDYYQETTQTPLSLSDLDFDFVK